MMDRLCFAREWTGQSTLGKVPDYMPKTASQANLLDAAREAGLLRGVQLHFGKPPHNYGPISQQS